MKNYTILNREYVTLNFELAGIQPGAGDIWVHLAPLGDFSGTLRGADGETETPCLQRIDHAALNAIKSGFKPKLLVDFEHRSMFPGGDTSAAAWILDLEERPDGLWGHLDLSDLGETAINKKRYRHLSPAFETEPVGVGADGVDIVRPIGLISAGLTNTHNLKALKPLTNSAAAASQKGPKPMKEIAIALGLPETAGMPELLAAIELLKTAKTEGATANARVVELEGTVLNAEADTFIAANAAKIKDAPAVKKQYVANKDATIALFASLADGTAAKSATVHNRAGAKTPDGGSVVLDRAVEQEVFVQQVRNREKCNYKAAFNVARKEKPALFTEEAKAD